ncbi:ISAzo13-like element transposase-related protein [Tunicatimonas pelagia]|uniref:ISAzo13-like element transposase-related protein n=1 Tax=Tunicatimonas pelagia TaxID=931531 RepID=UPI00345C723B
MLSSVTKVINTIRNMTCKGINPLVSLIDKQYQKGIKLDKKQMRQREEYLFRNQQLPKWDVWIKPSFYMGRLFLH